MNILACNPEVQKLIDEIEELDSEAICRAIVDHDVKKSNSVFNIITQKKHDLEWLTWWYNT